MKTAADYFDLVKTRYAIKSDYALAEFIGMARSSISMSRKHSMTLDEKTSLRIAELLEIDPAIIFAEMKSQLAKSEEEKGVWERMAAFFRGDHDDDGTPPNNGKNTEKPNKQSAKNNGDTAGIARDIKDNFYGLIDFNSLNNIYLIRCYIKAKLKT